MKPNKSSDSLIEVGCLFANNQATTSRHFAWTLREDNKDNSSSNDDERYPTTTSAVNDKDEEQQQRLVRVVLHHVADNDPGALQSGHYLWPAAEMLAEHLIQNYNNNNNKTIESVLELGAGCALPTLVALQVWQRSVQCLIVTDHDATVLQRAVDNHESTLEAILNASLSDNELNTAINCVGSIPVLFEKLEWEHAITATSAAAAATTTTTTTSDSSSKTATATNNRFQSIREQLLEHTNSQTDTVDVVLGSDLIYHISVVAPLLETAAQVMHPVHGRFWLAQSFAYDGDVEQEIDTVCQRLGLVRTILVQEDHGKRIQEFCFAPAEAWGDGVENEAALKQDHANSQSEDEKERQNGITNEESEPTQVANQDDTNKEQHAVSQKDEIVQEGNQKGETTCEQAGVIAETSKNQDGAEDDLSELNDKANEDQ